MEKALGLLPAVEALAPLRELLLSISRPDEGALWASSGPYLTVGKRGVQADELMRRVPEAFRRVTDHLQALYAASLQALDAQQRGEGGDVAAALLKGGHLEEIGGRLAQARAWYEVALRVSEALQDRRPEVEVLRALGALSLTLGAFNDGARHFQRALVLAEAEFDQAGAIAACEGLGDAALGQGQWSGGRSWYARGLRLAESSGDRQRLGRLERQLGVLAQRQGDLNDAGEHLRRARDWLESTGLAGEMARVLAAQGSLEAQSGRYTAAQGAFREALAWAQKAPEDTSLEFWIRMSIADLHLEAGRLLEAEEELRRAEEAAISGNAAVRLIELYTLMGKLRGRQQDETGFVFFEEAVGLCRMLGCSPAVEAQVFFEYGLFRQHLEQMEEARAYFERARGLFASVGESVKRERAESELRKLSA